MSRRLSPRLNRASDSWLSGAVFLQRLVQVQVQHDRVGQGLFALPGLPRIVSAAGRQQHDDQPDQREKAHEEAEHGVSRKIRSWTKRPDMPGYLSIWWYSGLGIISTAEATRLDML